LHHLYRAMAWLAEELPEKDRDGRTPFAPRCLKDVVAERLFVHWRDLLTRLDLVFMDTTRASPPGGMAMYALPTGVNHRTAAFAYRGGSPWDKRDSVSDRRARAASAGRPPDRHWSWQNDR
jgi:hypothetical protein